MRRDTRPAWMLRKHARISSRRRSAVVGAQPPEDQATWWEQIRAAAADLQLEPGAVGDWQAWPAEQLED